MTLSELVAAITAIAQDSAYTAENVKARINAMVLKIASGVMIPGKYELSPPLPALYTVGSVTTVAGSGIADLPADFNRGVVQVLNAAFEPMRVTPSFRKFLQANPEQGAGPVIRCSVYGTKLLYRDIPATPEVLTVHYHQAPAVLVQDTDAPDCIPETLHRQLIVNGVLRDLFDEIEDETDSPKKNTAFHENEFFKGILQLELLVGADGEPDHYDDQAEYID
jgi:hypothetical protein